MSWIIARLQEPSTWAAISSAALAVGVSVSQTTIGAIAAGVAAVLGVIFKEKS